MKGTNMLVQFSLIGRIPSKKNNKQIVGRGGRRFLMSSHEYQEWEKYAVNTLKSQRSFIGGIWPIERCHVQIVVVFPDKRRRDLTNVAEGIMDSMVKAGIITDDSWQYIPGIEVLFGGVNKNEPGATIILFKE